MTKTVIRKPQLTVTELCVWEYEMLLLIFADLLPNDEWRGARPEDYGWRRMEIDVIWLSPGNSL